MYAVVESGGKQYKVEKGGSILVDRLAVEEGGKVDLRAVMFRGDEVIADAAGLEKVKVEAKVTEHLRGPKIKVFKMKAKKGYRRRAGHRSELTRLEVTEVRQLTRKPTAAKTAEPAAAKSETATAAAKPAAAKARPATAKPAATKPKPAATRAKPAASKTKPAAAKAKPAAVKSKESTTKKDEG